MTIGFNLSTNLLTPNTNINWGLDQAVNMNYSNNMALINMLCMPSIGAGDSVPYCMDYPMFPCMGFGGFGSFGFGLPTPSLFMCGNNTNTIQTWQNLGNYLGNSLSAPFYKLSNAVGNLFCSTG